MKVKTTYLRQLKELGKFMKIPTNKAFQNRMGFQPCSDLQKRRALLATFSARLTATLGTQEIQGRIVQIYFSLTIFVLCASITACTPLSVQNCSPGEEMAIHDSLYFGTGKTDGFITHKEWSSFLETTVTPLFPEGLTVSSASGQWRGANGSIIQEPTYILSLVHTDSKDYESAIAEITRTYKQKFKQEAVLRVKNRTCVSF